MSNCRRLLDVRLVGEVIAGVLSSAKQVNLLKGETMGISQLVNANTFPQQGRDLGRRVQVVFYRDTSRQFPGVIVRDDDALPWVGIIKLDDGRYVLMTECQYSVEPRQGGS
jgi:hypothetical protein